MSEKKLRDKIAKSICEDLDDENWEDCDIETNIAYQNEADSVISLFAEYVKGCEPSALDIDEMLGDMTKERYLARHCTYQEASTLIHATISKVMEGLG